MAAGQKLFLACGLSSVTKKELELDMKFGTIVVRQAIDTYLKKMPFLRQ